MLLAESLAEFDHSLVPEIIDLAHEVADHPLFSALRTIDDVRLFMEYHVWAVWDFMTLLKSLQAELAPVSLPWRPTGDAPTARLINEIVLGEETDSGPDGVPASHFEIYLDAMRAAGADRNAVDRFLKVLEIGLPAQTALAEAQPPPASARFVRSTLEAARAPLPHRVAAFTLAREDIIPTMFRQLVSGLAQAHGDRDLRPLLWYLERHVIVDSSEHGPMAERLFRRICLADGHTREHAFAGARGALHERKLLWDSLLEAVSMR